MVTAYTTALPASALPPLGSTLAVIGPPLLLGAVLGALAVLAGVLVRQALLAAKRRQPTLRLVEDPRAGTAPRRAA